MHARAPDPATQAVADSLWLAYRTHRGDHFAVIEFAGVGSWTLDRAGDEPPEARPQIAGLARSAFHRLRNPALLRSGPQRWVVTFPDDTLLVTARTAAVVRRALQAQDGPGALAMMLEAGP